MNSPKQLLLKTKRQSRTIITAHTLLTGTLNVLLRETASTPAAILITKTYNMSKLQLQLFQTISHN